MAQTLKCCAHFCTNETPTFPILKNSKTCGGGAGEMTLDGRIFQRTLRLSSNRHFRFILHDLCTISLSNRMSILFDHQLLEQKSQYVRTMRTSNKNPPPPIRQRSFDRTMQKRRPRIIDCERIFQFMAIRPILGRFESMARREYSTLGHIPYPHTYTSKRTPT